MRAHSRRQNNALRWRLLSTDMGHRLCTELQKEREIERRGRRRWWWWWVGEGGTLRFPDFSQPSPLCRFHSTADSEARRRRRRRHAPCVPQSRIHFTQPASPYTRTDLDEVSTATRRECVVVLCVVFFLLSRTCSAGRPRAPPTPPPPLARLPRPGLVSAVCRRRRPVSRPDSPEAGNIKKPQTLGWLGGGSM